MQAALFGRQRRAASGVGTEVQGVANGAALGLVRRAAAERACVPSGCGRVCACARGGAGQGRPGNGARGSSANREAAASLRAREWGTGRANSGVCVCVRLGSGEGWHGRVARRRPWRSAARAGSSREREGPSARGRRKEREREGEKEKRRMGKRKEKEKGGEREIKRERERGERVGADRGRGRPRVVSVARDAQAEGQTGRWDSGRFGYRLGSSGYQEIRREMIQEGIELEERFRQNKD